MVLIGIDPHKGSHTAVAIDSDEMKLDEVRVRANRRQVERLMSWAAPFETRTWAVESAGGLEYLLSQQLVNAGEHVIDVPATLSAKVRLLTAGSPGKTIPTTRCRPPWRPLRSPRLRVVTAEDHVAVLRLLADRNHDLGRLRTQAICRLHAVLCALTAEARVGTAFLAVDGWSGQTFRWLQANAHTYGWHHPPWARIDGSKPEPWHWESTS